ncbi:TonB-dependent receptor [Lysobacter sp. GX 14042]|uniref:TonB-dependent receptor domain-containing protein n=1 Tax=Lysobacter sp. GX 14042 TaxID=2907155 RepID=UPI001F42F77B|nr:TonB-dependent receptor [Lysobacter sp. GX 14042]MCE7033011.1 TonB-dependent receptor [Lysobacter sp. GX 14042]
MKTYRKTVLAMVVGATLAGTPAFAQTPPAVEPDATRPPANDDAQPRAADRATGQDPAGRMAELDQVVVVGSRFAGNNEAGMVPVAVMDEAEIEATGAVSGEELLRSLPQVGDMMFDNTDTAANINAARGDIGSVNLRNLGTGNTLLLVNGRRMVPHPGTQTENLVPRQTANMNAVPLYGVRQMEVLMGGASALYGSDAVAGVLNVVMDTHFQGLEVQAQYGGSEDIDLRQGNLNFKAGSWFNDGRTRVTLLGGHTYRSEVAASEHPLTADMDRRALLQGTSLEGHLSFDDRYTTTSWGAFQTVGGVPVARDGTPLTSASGYFNIQPPEHRCGVELDSGVCMQTGGFNSSLDRPLRFNALTQRNILGGVGRSNLFGTVEQDINDDFVAFGEVSYYQAKFESMREQAASLGAAPMIVPASNYYNPFGAMYLPDGSPNPNRLPGIDAPEEGLDLRITSYRATDTSRPYEVNDDSYRVLGGVRGYLGGFDWESAVLYSRATTEDIQHGSISNTLFAEALARSDPGAYNPFNGGDPGDWTGVDGTPSDAATIAGFTVPVRRYSTASLFQVDSRFLHEQIFSLPAGDVGLAFGAEWRRESLSDQRDPRLNGDITYTNPMTGEVTSDVLGASPSASNSGSRNVASFYTELAVPVVSPQMQVPLVRSLDLQLAGRWEKYSDFGWVANPKVALAWTVTDDFMVRGNWAQSFLAPNILQLYADGATVSNTRTDYYVCEADIRAGRIESFSQCGRSSSTQAERSGNRELQPETSDAYSVGFVFQPTFLPQGAGKLTLTADYWVIEQEDVIGILGEQAQLALDYLARMQGSSNPNVIRNDPDDTRVADFEGTGLDPVGTVSLVYDRYINRLPRTTRGIDFGLTQRITTDHAGTFNLSANASRLIERTQDPVPDEQMILEAQQAGIINDGFRLSSAGNLLGINGSPEWRATFNASWRQGDWLTGTHVRYVGPFETTGVLHDDGSRMRIPSWTTANLYLERRFEGLGNFLDGSRVRLTVRNVADRDPPISGTAIGFYSSVHNVLGRGYYLTLTKSFD